MDGILHPVFLRRLRSLRGRLAGALRRRETPRQSPAGEGRSPEFESHREYAPGDDPRYIDWSLYARLDRFFIKSNEREEEGVVHVLLDASESMRRPRPEKEALAREVAAAVAYLGLCAGNTVWLSAWAERLLRTDGPFRGEAQTLRMLKSLDRLGAGRGTDLDASLGAFLRTPRSGGTTAVLLSDFIDESAYGPKVRYLLHRDVRLGAVQVLAPEEADLRLRGNLLVEDPESGASARLLVGYAASRELQRRVDEFLLGTERFFARRAARFVRATTARRFEDVAVDYFLKARQA